MTQPPHSPTADRGGTSSELPEAPHGFGTLLPDINTAVPGPGSTALTERLARVESRNVTDLSGKGPIFWARAAGANVQDVDGNVYVDLGGAFGVAAVGHAHSSVVEAITVQSEVLLHGMGDIHPSRIKVQLLERLAELAPWPDTRSVLASGGSEAVEIALKTAELATGRSEIIAFEGSYHGLTLGSLAATHRDHFRAPFRERTYGGVHFVPFPGHAEEAERVINRVAELLTANPSIGAVLVEPIQGRAGVRIPPSGFLAAVGAQARGVGAILIADEIFTGLGRVGARWASVADGCVPDMICAGKALGGGMPISVCMGPRHIMDAWPESSGEAMHTSTFLGHPVSCAAALASLSEIDAAGLVERSKDEGAAWVDRLKRVFGGHEHVREVRGRGQMIGIELTPAGEAAHGGGPAAALRVLEAGYILLPAGDRGQVLELTPPLVITEAQMDAATQLLERVLSP